MSNLKKISPSKIDSLSTCSWNFYASYYLNVPSENNDGARRGTIVHDFCEILIKNRERHKKIFDEIIKNNTIYCLKSVEKLFRLKSKKLGLKFDELSVDRNNKLILNKDLLDEMTLTALKNRFYGEDGDIILAERKGELDVDDKSRDVRYIATGFIDKMFIRGDMAEIVDYKTSKQKFKDEKLEFNMQAFIYQLFAKKLFPEIKDTKMSFLFLQFPEDPWLIAPKFNDELINGVEIYLTGIFKLINNFTEKAALFNLAKKNGKHFLCGKDGFKKTSYRGSMEKIQTNIPNWECPMKKPFEYYEVFCNEKKTCLLKTKDHNDLYDYCDTKKYLIFKRRYAGCPAWNK